MVSGASLVIQRLAEGTAALGHSVEVITASDRRSAYVQSQDGLEIIRIHSYPNPLRVGQNFVLWSHEDIYQALKQFQPDIMHLHDPLNLGVSAVRAARRLNIRSVLTVHQLPWFIATYAPVTPGVARFIEDSAWRYSSWLLKQFDAAIAPSKMIADIIRRHTPFNPHVISNGVDLDGFTPKPGHPDEPFELCQKYGLRSDRPILLYVGRIDADKKVDLVVQAAAQVIKHTDAQLLVVGDGRQREEIMGISTSLGIEAYCCFPGYVSKSEDLPGLYRLSTVFVTASEVEIQSSVVLEAAASGLPVVTVEASSMPELVIAGESGYLVPPGDVEALAERVRVLLKDPHLVKTMGQAGRARVEVHSNERFIQSHERLYESIMTPAKA
jgi:glycosyltransferase involved in cell wall biosynthesis